MRAPPILVSIARTLGSLRLTVWLLAAAILLVFFGTLEQRYIGIREAQRVYFESLLAVYRYPMDWPMGNILHHLPLPIPGGYLIGPLLALNLVFSHIRHFRLRWKVAGISLIHAGVLLLLIGQLVTNLSQEEYNVWLDEGETTNFVRSFNDNELYILKWNNEGRMGVFSFPYDDLREGRTIDPENYPFELRVKEVFDNAQLQSAVAAEGLQPIGVTRGIGAQFNLSVKKIPSFRSDDQKDVKTAVVEVVRDNQVIGSWLVSNVFEERFPEQEFTVDGTRYAVGLRFKKKYLPYSITLLDFKHDRYPGTNIPMNFSSKVRINHPGKGDTREITIFMNNPLRYEGLTYYQASFAKQDTASMLQVVRNPGRHLPYIACTLVSIGLIYQFGWVLYRYTRRVSK